MSATTRLWSCTAGRSATCPAAPLEHAALLAALGDEAAATDENARPRPPYEDAHAGCTGAGPPSRRPPPWPAAVARRTCSATT